MGSLNIFITNDSQGTKKPLTVKQGKNLIYTSHPIQLVQAPSKIKTSISRFEFIFVRLKFESSLTKSRIRLKAFSIRFFIFSNRKEHIPDSFVDRAVSSFCEIPFPFRKCPLEANVQSEPREIVLEHAQLQTILHLPSSHIFHTAPFSTLENFSPLIA